MSEIDWNDLLARVGNSPVARVKDALVNSGVNTWTQILPDQKQDIVPQLSVFIRREAVHGSEAKTFDDPEQARQWGEAWRKFRGILCAVPAATSKPTAQRDRSLPVPSPSSSSAVPTAKPEHDLPTPSVAPKPSRRGNTQPVPTPKEARAHKGGEELSSAMYAGDMYAQLEMCAEQQAKSVLQATLLRCFEQAMGDLRILEDKEERARASVARLACKSNACRFVPPAELMEFEEGEEGEEDEEDEEDEDAGPTEEP